MQTAQAEVADQDTETIEKEGGSGIDELSPREIVAALDEYVIAQSEAKRAVAVALRNRWRRMQVAADLREEITPKNIIMIGSTGVGKTEISRRLAKLANAPFAKVEASKFTEVGYVGRDVESIVRDLVDAAYVMEKELERERVAEEAQALVEQRLLDVLLPSEDAESATREKLRTLLRNGALEERMVEIELEKKVHRHIEVLTPGSGVGEVEGQLKDMFGSMMPKVHETRKVSVSQARDLLQEEISENLIDADAIGRSAIERAQQCGIIFIDEIDKICASSDGGRTADVSREGVQRDLLPLVEGCTVSTKYGSLKTDHILFIASGAFHQSKPSDLMPEFQGRFPIRVELQSLSEDDFYRILREPKNAITSQYTALLETEGVMLSFCDEALAEIAKLTAEVNAKTENIGARRLHTILERLLDEISFSADSRRGEKIHIDKQYVQEQLKDVVADLDLARFIL